MKKLVLGIALSLAVLSCNKKEEAATSEHTSVDTLTVAEPAASVALKEVSKAELSQLLQPKDNDTLYVTNFFATWCGPCMKEIPHFKEQMKALSGKPVRFTFISLDEKEDWDTKVKAFGEENGLSSHILLFDGKQLDDDFFKNHFKTWKGEGIPFTLIQKGKNSSETEGSMSAEELDKKLNAF
ncbi:TlpA family protein disulfide reductase [Riemerella columbina]|uniref:TlpA family protein disulfide reductase n=1 Tax=Riemerella columbina TaxID=103810 RepID=UPI00267004E4|nr:TlpA disulfide reductase family protein [Riemerella columbina]WKS94394.1 TlpA family protein disulfide reductase [Riemerella columbina]